MKKWLKENWFKAGILIIVLVGVLSVSYYYVVILPRINSQRSASSQPNTTSTTWQTINPLVQTTTPTTPVATQQTNQDTEDPTLKIARCQSDAQIAKEQDTSRYNQAVAPDELACSSNPQCNFANESSLLQSLAESNGESWYEQIYNVCLQIPESAFDNLTQTFNGYWAKCIAENPEVSDADTSGAEGMNIYNAQQACVNNLIATEGI